MDEPQTLKSNIDLGFIAETDSWRIRSKFFPSKLGGIPAWLALENLPSLTDLQCIKCTKPLVFLCQIYAPDTSKDECFHRTFFVFVCREANCTSDNDASNIRVFRCQLPRENKYYSIKPPEEVEEGSDKPSAADYVKLCRVCGSLGPKACGSCKLVNYCSRDHQSLDWKGHKSECQNKMVVSKESSHKGFLFPEYEIEMESEEIENLKEKSDEEVLQAYEAFLKRGKSDVAEDLNASDLIKTAAKETDKQFAIFRTRVEHYPDQIIRYERNGKPLFVSHQNKPEQIPCCEKCGQDRIFEFQIMPQLLVHLDLDSKGKSLDWGIILVYTCPNSCGQAGEYVKEAVFKQDYTPSTDFLKQ